MNPTGTHILIDLYGVDDPGEQSLSILYKIANLVECRIMAEGEHVFEGGGRTAFLILSQSHASIHTWPEHRYISIDLYSCKQVGPERIERVIRFIENTLHAEEVDFRVVERGSSIR